MVKPFGSHMCVFCNIEPSRVVLETEHARVIYDQYPVTALHALVLPKRHVASVFELHRHEIEDILSALALAKQHIADSDPLVRSFNIGVNDGIEAGQTIPHCHVHLIPRRVGDMPDPRGGVRGVIPSMQKYSFLK